MREFCVDCSEFTVCGIKRLTDLDLLDGQKGPILIIGLGFDKIYWEPLFLITRETLVLLVFASNKVIWGFKA